MTVPAVEERPAPAPRKHNGPYPVPAWNLRVAAIEYAAAVEVSAPDLPQAWDRLRAAAKRYTAAAKRKGRPRSAPLRREEGASTPLGVDGEE